MVYDPAISEMVLFGGAEVTGGNLADLNDTWTFDGATWTELSPPTTPPPTDSISPPTSMVYDPATGQVILYDYNSNTMVGTFWAFDGSTWTEQATPTAAFESMAYDPSVGEVVGLFEGEAIVGGKQTVVSQTWTFDGSTWSQLSAVTSSPSKGTDSMVYDGAANDLIGYNTGDPSTWTFNGVAWNELSITTPAQDFEPSMVYDPTVGQVVLYGGGNGSGNFDAGPPWTFDGSTWTEQTSAPNGGTITPAMAFDPSIGQIVVFGGTDQGLDGENQTWLLGYSASPDQIPVSVTGSQNYGSTPTFVSNFTSPAGVNITGSVICTTVNDGTPITPTLGAGTYSIDASTCGGLNSSDPIDDPISYVGGSLVVAPGSIALTASGSQTYGSTPTFTPTFTAPSGVSVTGTLVCTTVNGGTPIDPSLAPGGSYTIDGSSCSGLTSSDPGSISQSHTRVAPYL